MQRCFDSLIDDGIAGYEVPTSFKIRIRRISFVGAAAIGCDRRMGYKCRNSDPEDAPVLPLLRCPDGARPKCRSDTIIP